MRKREEILKDYIDLGLIGNNLMRKDQKGLLINPKLQLEVLLDIRDLLIDLNNK